MPKIVSNKTSIAHIRRSFKANPELEHMTPYVAGGLRIVNFAFDALSEAQKIKAPPGIEIGDIMVRVKNTNSVRAIGEMTTAVWILEVLKKSIGYLDEDV
jgi:hypothetical protein